MKIRRSIVLVLMIATNSAFATKMPTFGGSGSTPNCNIVTHGEAESQPPRKGCLKDLCGEDVQGHETGCVYICPGDPGFPEPKTPPGEDPKPKPKDPDSPENPDGPQTPPPEPEPTPPSTPDDGGVPTSPEAPPSSPDTGGPGDFEECAQNNANCIPPDIDPSIGGFPGLTKPGKITVGTPAHVDCNDPRVNCVDLGIGAPPVELKPIKDKNGHLNCLNPAVTCVEPTPEPETSSLDKGCEGEKKPVEVLPYLSGLGLGKADEFTSILCQLNPNHFGCEEPVISGSRDILCQLNPNSEGCKNPIFSGTPVFSPDGKGPKIPTGVTSFCILHPSEIKCLQTRPW